MNESALSGSNAHYGTSKYRGDGGVLELLDAFIVMGPALARAVNVSRSTYAAIHRYPFGLFPSISCSPKLFKEEWRRRANEVPIQ